MDVKTLLAVLAVLTTSAFAPPVGAQPRRADERPPPEESPPAKEPAGREPLPIASDPPPAEPHEPPTEPDEQRHAEGSAAAITVEVGGHGEHVDLDGAKTGVGGALGGHLFVMGYSGALTYRVFVNGAIGGQTTGFLTRFGGDASIGPALALGSSSRLFIRVGADAHGHKDDELDASLFTLPSAYGGIQLNSETVLFEIGPRAGTTLRADYAPGNETEGRRHARRSRVAPSWGGTMALASTFLLLEASLTRVEQTAGLWLVEGSVCPIVSSKGGQIFVICAAAQHWRGRAVGPLGDTPEVGSWSFGASFGIGYGKNRRP